jgi:hypothetical protein
LHHAIEGQEDEGASLDVRGIGAHFRCGFFTILDKVLTVGESAGGKEQAAWLHSQPEDLLEGAGGGARNNAAADFAEALRR